MGQDRWATWFLVISILGLVGWFIYDTVVIYPKERVAVRVTLEAGPTITTPIRSININSGQVSMVYKAPNQIIQGVVFRLADTTSGYLKGRVIEITGSSEVEWYNDGVWEINRIKQIRLSSQDLRAIGSPTL